MRLATIFNHPAQYDLIWSGLRAIIFIIIGYIVAHFASTIIMRFYEKRAKAKSGLLIHKIVFYFIFILFIISAMHELGFDLKILLGATGILTVALGFASQTSASNFISGLFVLGERAIHVGDTININNIVGDVISIDLFSVKLRQSDNTLVRIPNETMIKTQFVNLTHFPTRRFECDFSVPPTTDITALRKNIFNLLSKEPLCLKNPPPWLGVKALANDAVKLSLRVYANQANFHEMQYTVQEKLLALLPSFDNTYTVRLLKEPIHDKSDNDLS